jgi:hypothetical protein
MPLPYAVSTDRACRYVKNRLQSKEIVTIAIVYHRQDRLSRRPTEKWDAAEEWVVSTVSRAGEILNEDLGLIYAPCDHLGLKGWDSLRFYKAPLG